MRLKKLKLRMSTCFGFGIAGAACGLGAGIMQVAGVGEAQYFQTAGFILIGVMLLLLAGLQKGKEARGLRVKLLVLFIALLLAWLRLPPLELLEVPVVPLLLWFSRDGEENDIPWLVGLSLCEVAQGVVRTVGDVELLGGREILFGGQTLLFTGAALILVNLARGVVLARLYRRAKANQPKPGVEEPPRGTPLGR